MNMAGMTRTLFYAWASCSLGPKGVSEEDWYCAYPSTMNSRVPTGCAHFILGVTDEVSPYEAITKGFSKFGIKNPLLWLHMEILDQ